MRYQLFIVILGALIWGCASSRSVSTNSTVSPISVPFTFRDFEINRTPQSIHYEYKDDSTTVVYFDTSKVTIDRNQTKTIAHWDSETTLNGVREKYPSVKNKVQPVFPFIAQRAGVEAKIIAIAFIGTSGQLSKVIIALSGAEIFNDPVVEAVKQWDFQPAHSGQSILPVRAILEFDFIIEHGKALVLMPY